MLNELNLTPELLEKAKSATSATALLAFAQENDITLTTEEAANYYTQLHPETGTLSDEELDNVAGGGGMCNPYPCPSCTSTKTRSSASYFKCLNCNKTGTIMGGKITLRE